MNVLAWTDVLARYDELSKLPNVGSSSVQDNLMNLAEAQVHSRLASRFTTPFSTTNLTAKDLMVDALYVQAMLTRQPEKAKALADNLDERIKALLAGQSSMVTSSGSVASLMVGDTIWSSTQDYPPVFGMSDIEHAQVSSEQLYDEAATRGEYL